MPAVFAAKKTPHTKRPCFEVKKEVPDATYKADVHYLPRTRHG
jgi:hypothetical protein